MIDPISAMSIASSGITVTTSPDYLLDCLTAGYVLLTLALAIIAFRSLSKTQASLDLTRQQIELNKQQSQEASAASERHSQATIAAVNKQIAASEAQSQAAIEVVNRQIVASERQAQEALYNQQKPVLVPAGGLGNIIETLDGKSYVVWGNQNRVIDGLRNIGVGPAFNIYGILFGPPLNSLPPHARYVVWNYPPLSPGEEGDKITLEQFTNLNSETTMGGYPLYIPEDVDHIGIIARFTLTYHDVFNRKHASIYDYHAQYGWRCRGNFPNIEYDIRELDRQTRMTRQAEQFWFAAGKTAQS
jgi:hypothetical protein